jgi:hypothetical protein
MGIGSFCDVSEDAVRRRYEADHAIEHECFPPALESRGGTQMQRPDWTCGGCGRVWRMWNGGGTGSIFWWVEVRGPTDGEYEPNDRSPAVKATKDES